MPGGRPKGSVGIKKRSQASSQQSLGQSLTQHQCDESDSDVEALQIEAVSSLATKINGLKSRMVKEFESLQQEFSKTIDDLRQSVEEIKAENTALKQRCSSLENRLKILEDNRLSHSQLINKNERFSRRNNIRIVGFTTQDGENCLEIAKKVLNEVGIQDCRLERAHRDGRSVPNRDRHILVKLSYYQDKVTTFKHAREALSNNRYYIIDNLTKIDLAGERKRKSEVQDLRNKAPDNVFDKVVGVEATVNHIILGKHEHVHSFTDVFSTFTFRQVPGGHVNVTIC